MRTLCKRAGVAYFRFHALRHFGALVLDRANMPIGLIQRILGHENRTTTEIYLHSIDKIDRAVMEYLWAQIEKKSHTVGGQWQKGQTKRRLTPYYNEQFGGP